VIVIAQSGHGEQGVDVRLHHSDPYDPLAREEVRSRGRAERHDISPPVPEGTRQAERRCWCSFASIRHPKTTACATGVPVKLRRIRCVSLPHARLNRVGPNPVGNVERWEIGSDGAIDTARTVPQAKPVTGLGSIGGPHPYDGHCHRGVRRALHVMRQR
jgi:hypothetical protein